MAKRKQIVTRLHQVVASVDGIRTCERNRMAFDETQLPAATILNGDDEVSDQDSENVRKRHPSALKIVTALPQVVVFVKDGDELDDLHQIVINKVMNDADLIALTLNGDGVLYRGMQSTFHAARWSDAGFEALIFGFRHILDPTAS